MIRYESVHKSYGDTPALRGMDLHIHEGELFVLIGPSGCGKTTSLKLVNRLADPD